ncbi:MAG TPA: OmpA family protein [Pyrinomonadaceae bacterium]|jgi:outer membrane protein OmpA-like peptidoglycan-associated protein
MNILRSPICRTLTIATLFATTFFIASPVVSAQTDARRQTVAVTYPLDQSVSVKFQGTTRLPRLTGEAKVRRTGRRGTRVEMEIKNLPRAFELGSVYTTFVLWAISPEGRADNLGEIKRSGSFIINSKVDVTTPLQTFAMIVTAEPHFLVRGPSRMVVLENLPPRNPGDADIATVNVQYIGNTSDYFNEQRVPEVADADYIKTPVSLLGARQSINLARYLGAQRDAPAELKEAEDVLEQAESAWRLKQAEEDVDALARRATSLGARAEEVAESRRVARQRRDEIARRDEAVREAEETASNASQQIADLRAALQREQHAREIAERDSANANQQLRDLRSEIARLRDELQNVRANSEEARVRLARIEGERSAEVARRAAEERAAKQREAASALKQTLTRFGTVRETERGLVLVLPETLWTGARVAELAPRASATVEPLAALLANNPDYRIVIEAYTDSQGDTTALQQLTQDRAEALAGQLVAAGVDSARIQASGMGTANPVASNARPATRQRNRRTEITLVPAPTSDTDTADRSEN